MAEKTNRQATGNVDKTFTMVDCFVDRCWDMWSLSIGSFAWSNDQIEQITKRYMDQRKTAIEEGSKVIGQIVKQIQTDQNHMRNMIKDTIKGTIDNTENPILYYWADLNKKVSELSVNKTNVA